MKSSTKYLSLVGLVLSLAACGTPQQMPDMETPDAAADSQQMIQEDSSRASDAVSEETSTGTEDSSVESGASDSGTNISDSSVEASVDSGSLVREPNVMYRTSDGGYEGIIELSGPEIISDGGVTPFAAAIRNRYANRETISQDSTIVARATFAGCSVVDILPRNVLRDSVYIDGGMPRFSFSISAGCAANRLIIETCTNTVNAFTAGCIRTLSKNVRVE